MFSPKFAWNDYFTGSPATTLNSTEYTSRQTPSVSSVYVFNCLFNKCTVSSGNGGALYCSTSVTYLFVEYSYFFSCKTNSGQGGAIYFSNSNALQSVLYAVCGYDCWATSLGPFAGIIIKNDATYKNRFNYSAIVRCIGDASGACETICLQHGRVFCQSVNSSMNKCTSYSGIYLQPTADSSSVTCSLLYSTIVDIMVTNYICIYCGGGAKHEIKCCNILRNTQVSSSNGIIYSYGNLLIEDSCILENSATYIFCSSYTITLSNCTVDSTTNNGRLTTQNTVTKSFIHGLNHISTKNCHSEYDSAGILTAIPYVSHSTKKAICYTYKIIHYHVRTSYLFTLHWVFIATFIHPNPSGDF